MVKNVKGGSGHKGLARKHVVFASSGPTHTRLKEDVEFERYAIVTTMLGDKCFVLCDDDKKRLCCIRGKFRGRKKRDNLVVVGGWVLVGLRSFETEKSSSSSSSSSSSYVGKCDLMEIYGDNEKRAMQEKAPADFRNMSEKGAGIGKSKTADPFYDKKEGYDDSFDFVSDMESDARKMEEAKKLMDLQKIDFAMHDMTCKEGNENDEDEDDDDSFNIDDI